MVSVSVTRGIAAVWFGPLCLGCTLGGGEVVITDARLSTVDDAVAVEIDIRNAGPWRVYAQTWPHRLGVRPTEDGFIIAVTTDEPGDHLDDPLAGFEPVIRYERLSSANNPVGGSRTTLEIALPSGSTAVDPETGEQVPFSYPHAEWFAVELAWHDDDPGQVDRQNAPDPDGVATFEWVAEQ